MHRTLPVIAFRTQMIAQYNTCYQRPRLNDFESNLAMKIQPKNKSVIMILKQGQGRSIPRIHNSTSPW